MSASGKLKYLSLYILFRSIARNANVDRERLLKYLDEEVVDGVLPLHDERELKLAKQLLHFSDVMLHVLESLQLHKICDYIYSLATVFNDFYKYCYVVETNQETGAQTINYHRLVLCEVTVDTMKKCFEILGIRPIEAM
jgi:arginyl-tRNA synthetase